jgi:hypothetical protein
VCINLSHSDIILLLLVVYVGINNPNPFPDFFELTMLAPKHHGLDSKSDVGILMWLWIVGP